MSFQTASTTRQTIGYLHSFDCLFAKSLDIFNKNEGKRPTLLTGRFEQKEDDLPTVDMPKNSNVKFHL